MFRVFGGILLALAGILIGSCSSATELTLPAQSQSAPADDGWRMVTRLAQISDTHVVDTLSPARFPGAHNITRSAWRPYEAYATQLFDGVVRTVNRIHAGGTTIDFLLHTGDAVDNVQGNELAWFEAILAGTPVNPLSGPDDRPVDERPPAELDPYAAFTPQGLYRNGVLGERPTIPWYIVPGNHDVRAIGVFPIFADEAGDRVAPLPLPGRPGLVLPIELDPTTDSAYGPVSPAFPGPPPLLNEPVMITPIAERAYFDLGEMIDSVAADASAPDLHGLGTAVASAAWYRVAPVPGLMLIGLNANDPTFVFRGGLNVEGAISPAQLQFLRESLAEAEAEGQWVIVASHHTSNDLVPLAGSSVSPEEFRAVLSASPRVVAHLCGHRHRHHVAQRDGYLEIETCSTLDWPQEGRLVEIWERPASGEVAVAYDVFSHLDVARPPLGEDPLRGMRERAADLARDDKQVALRRSEFDPDNAPPAGMTADRNGRVIVRRR